MKNLLIYILLLNVLVSYSQVRQGKYKLIVSWDGKPDSVYYVDDLKTAYKMCDDRRPTKHNSDTNKIWCDGKLCNKLNKNLDLKHLEYEFNKLYVKYIDSVFNITKNNSKVLDNAIYGQLNYLLNIDGINIITHQNKNFDTFNDRCKHYVEVPYESCGEIITEIGIGGDECEVAKIMFNNFLSSKPHKKIIDNVTLTYFNFKFGYTKSGRIIGIGFFAKLL